MALTIDIKSPEGTKVGDVTLPSEIFDVQANVPLIHQVVVAQLAAARQGTAKTKNRGEVSGTGKKPFKQREPAALVRALSVLHCSVTVVSHMVQYLVSTINAPQRR